MQTHNVFALIGALVITVLTALFGLAVKLCIPALIIMVLMKIFWSAYSLSWGVTILLPLFIGGIFWLMCLICGLIVKVLAD
jgi:hypothetical protein